MATGPVGVTPEERWSAPNEEARKNVTYFTFMSVVKRSEDIAVN